MHRVFLATCLLGACTVSEVPPELEPPSGCDPLDTALCVLPFPSDSFLEPDGDTVTGFRVAFGDGALPMNRDDVQIQPTYWNERDGFSINSHPLAYFADLSPDGLVSWLAPETYTDPDVTTVIVDTVTGERVAHFAEKDARIRNADEALLILRPLEALEFGRRYVVGIRGLHTLAGGEVAVSEAFAALRDGTATLQADVEDRRDHFDQSVFPVLEDQGFARDELQLAWDFTTMSRESSLGRMEWMRADALDRVGDGPTYTIDRFEDGNCEGGDPIGRTIYGHVDVPQYTEVAEPGTLLTRDERGWPYFNGTKQAPFLVRVPCSVTTGAAPAPVLQYGHGLLGSMGEARTGWLSRMADDFGWTVFAMHWTGMSEYDVAQILLMSAGDPSRFAFVPERSQQGFVEQMIGLRMMLTTFVDEPLMQFPDSDHDGVPDAGAHPAIDPTRRYYTGNSQGAILGAAYLAISPDLPRGVLGVGGHPYSLLLNRSVDFDLYFRLFQQKFLDDREISLLVNGLLQMLWDPGESAGYAHVLDRDPMEGNDPKQVLLQVARADAQVTHLGGRVQAMAFGAAAVQPHPEGSLFGLEDRVPPFEGSAYVEWDFTDVSSIPVENVPPDGIDPHECVRRDPRGQQQLYDFLVDGVVNTYCVDEGGTPVPCRGLAEGCR